MLSEWKYKIILHFSAVLACHDRAYPITYQVNGLTEEEWETRK